MMSDIKRCFFTRQITGLVSLIIDITSSVSIIQSLVQFTTVTLVSLSVGYAKFLMASRRGCLISALIDLPLNPEN
jgi:hypothetical protein